MGGGTLADTLTKEELARERGLAAQHARLDTGQAAEEAVEEHHGIDRRMITFFGIMAAIFLSALDQTMRRHRAPTRGWRAQGLRPLHLGHHGLPADQHLGGADRGASSPSSSAANASFSPGL